VIFEVEVRGQRHKVETTAGPDGVHIRAGGHVVLARIEPLAGAEWWHLVIDGEATPVRLRAGEGGLAVTLGPARVPLTVRRWLPVTTRRAAAAAGDRRVEIRAPMPGLVVETRVAAGQPVAAGAPVVIVEAMKMQMEVPAPAAGHVEEVRVRAGQEVAGGQLLVVVRPDAGPETGA
jgi:biotin carboxyl carrier protein